MFRGTNPIITMNLSCDPSLITKLKITFKQGTTIVLEKILTDCTIEDNKIKVQLSESDTLAFKSCTLQMQARIQLSTGDILVTDVLETYVDDIFNDASLDAKPIVPGKNTEEGYKVQFLNEKTLNIGDTLVDTHYQYFKIDIQRLQDILRKKFKNIDEIPTSISYRGSKESNTEHCVPLFKYCVPYYNREEYMIGLNANRISFDINENDNFASGDAGQNYFSMACYPERVNTYQSLENAFEIPNFYDFTSTIKFVIVPFLANFYSRDAIRSMEIVNLNAVNSLFSYDTITVNNFDSISDIEDDLRSCVTVFESIA